MGYLDRIWKNGSEVEEKTMSDETREYIKQLKHLNNVLGEKDGLLQSIQEDYKKIFNLFADMVILLDDSGSIIDLNKKSQILLNKHNFNDSLIGKKWKEVIEELGCKWDASIEKAALESDMSEEKEKEVYIDKLDKHFLISVTPVKKEHSADYFIVIIRDITKIKEREINLIKKQKFLNYINIIADVFSRNLNINYIMDKIVETLSDIDNVDLVYIYKNCSDGLEATKIREYHKNGEPIDISDTIKYNNFPRWIDYFRLNHIICGTSDEFPKHERRYLKQGNIKSICAVPIYTPEGFWGFIGFNSYKKEKHWTYDEEQLLKIASNVIGGEIYKWSLRNINNNVEDITPKCVNV